MVLEKLKVIDERLKKLIENNSIREYRIINNDLGKNLILVDSDILNFKLVKEELENDFKDYIEDIILKEETREIFLKRIEKLCKANSIGYTGPSYEGWTTKVENEKSSKIIVGYSFKGGMGRSQTLAYLSMFFSLIGKKIVVLDCDFEAPGIASILDSGMKERETKGILDYIIQLNIDKDEKISKYCFENEKIQNLHVVPSGIKNSNLDYILKLSKVNFNSKDYTNKFKIMLENIEQELKPDYIFVDLRAGINESNGHILTEISKKNLLFFNNDNQNICGLEIVLNQLKKLNGTLDDYYLINSTIRDYNKTIEKYKELKFRKKIKDDFEEYKNGFFNLIHQPLFLNDNFMELLKFVNNNVRLYSKINQEKEVKIAIDEINKLVRDIKMKPNISKEFTKILDLKERLEKKKSNATLDAQIAIESLLEIEERKYMVFLQELIEIILN